MNKLLEMSKDQTYFNGQVSFYQMSHQLNNRKGLLPPGGRSPVQYINQWKTKLPQINNSFIFNQLGNDELACYVLFGELIG
ncbi:hypothetical protein [Bacillus cereus]|uniref:hypothetical protein n=1 Tax=Bacillus cereus TaxID=1396 RepID=UPI000BFE0D8E|nr:hypothetical protein [Bacillus cereus]PGV79318.1 hypothetical protein COD84_08685 [Bacillus cereus]